MTPVHGEPIKLEDMVSAFARATTEFRYLFPSLTQEPDNLLPTDEQTVEGLRGLASSMQEDVDSIDSDIPAAFTYVGQFLDHDITLEAQSSELRNIDDPNVQPLDPSTISRHLVNGRQPTLDLDSVYSNVPRLDEDPRKLLIGSVSSVGNRPPEKDDNNDLPRNADVSARIGDGRNDENLIVAQLHLAFLRFHNAIVDKKSVSFSEARLDVQRHYQWMIWNDFVSRICTKSVFDDVSTIGRRHFNPGANAFMPIEFASAAYRFGHSMVRLEYNYNRNFKQAGLDELFRFTQESGNMAGLPTLPENWIIEWDRFVDSPGGGNPQMARAIDTGLVKFLFELRRPGGSPQTGIFQILAARNLVRAYVLSVPTGQSIAREMGENILSPNDILDLARNEDERNVVKSNKFHERTPFWYYCLVEGASEGGGGLGPVGSRVVAETIHGLIEGTPDNIFSSNWNPDMGSGSEFTLADLIVASGNL